MIHHFFFSLFLMSSSNSLRSIFTLNAFIFYFNKHSYCCFYNSINESLFLKNNTLRFVWALLSVFMILNRNFSIYRQLRHLSLQKQIPSVQPLKRLTRFLISQFDIHFKFLYLSCFRILVADLLSMLTEKMKQKRYFFYLMICGNKTRHITVNF